MYRYFLVVCSAFALVVGLSGCPDDDDGTFDPGPNPSGDSGSDVASDTSTTTDTGTTTDSGTADTSVTSDTGTTTDTGVVQDTGAEDTTSTDTSLADTTSEDTTVEDTTAGDQGSEDTTAEDTTNDDVAEDTTVDDVVDMGPVCKTPEAGDLLLVEVMMDPAGDVHSDTNCDTVDSGTQDEFIEFVNTAGECLDLSGLLVAGQEANGGIVFTLPDAVELADGGAVVVFGGGTPDFDGDPCAELGTCVQIFADGLQLTNDAEAVYLEIAILDVPGVCVGGSNADDECTTASQCDDGTCTATLIIDQTPTFSASDGISWVKIADDWFPHNSGTVDDGTDDLDALHSAGRLRDGSSYCE